MTKLIDKFVADSSIANAKKIVAYINKHPMAPCMLSIEQCAILNAAVILAQKEG